MLLPTKYDVIVIGAGAAGSAIAIQAAQAGLKVLILERQKFPRHRPGETLHPGIEPLLDQLGVGAAVRASKFLRHQGTWVHWDAEAIFNPFGSDSQGNWQGFQATRADFDAILLQRARQLGVEIKQPCRALNVLKQQDRIIGVKTSQGELFSEFLVDATGGFHWLARQLNLEIRKFSVPLLAYYGYVTGNCEARNQAPAIVADEAGWTWTARIQAELYQWTRLPFDSQKLASDWLPSEYLGLKPQGSIGKADVTWRSITQAAGNGYFIVGDAACVLDPASSHGVLKAMMSGMMAGHAIAKVLIDNQPESLIIKNYSDWILDWFQHDLLKLKEFYGKLHISLSI